MKSEVYITTYITCSNKEEAEKISEALVKERLAAGVNYFPINSVYAWKGKLERDREYALLSKTKKENFDKIKKRVKELHSYEVPAILALEISDGNKEFLEWINKSVK